MTIEPIIVPFLSRGVFGADVREKPPLSESSSRGSAVAGEEADVAARNPLTHCLNRLPPAHHAAVCFSPPCVLPCTEPFCTDWALPGPDLGSAIRIAPPDSVN